MNWVCRSAAGPDHSTLTLHKSLGNPAPLTKSELLRAGTARSVQGFNARTLWENPHPSRLPQGRAEARAQLKFDRDPRPAWRGRVRARFMESPLFLTDLLTAHEPDGSAGFPACEFRGLSSPRSPCRRKHGTGMSREPADRNVCATTQRFMESLHGLKSAHWDHERVTATLTPAFSHRVSA